jgi:outer membrane protein insertion porin family
MQLQRRTANPSKPLRPGATRRVAGRPWPRGAMLALLVVAAFLVGVAAAQTSPAPAVNPATNTPDVLAGKPISKVEIVGNTRTDTQVILSNIRTAPGQPYSRAAVDVDVRALASLGRFVTVQAEVIPQTGPNVKIITKVLVRFIVQERQLVSSVEIVGNRHIQDDKIRDLLVVHAGSPIDPFQIQTDVHSITEVYKKAGYAFVRVTVDDTLKDQKGIVRYAILEGPKSVIKHIRFAGNLNLKGSYLSWKIKTKSSFWIFRKGVVKDEDLESDDNTIATLYHDKGYLDARCSHSLEYSADRRFVTVRFIIDEGVKYHIASITTKGNKVFTTHELLSALTLKVGDDARKDRIEAVQKRIENRYGHEGYIYRTVDPVLSYTDAPNTVSVTYEISEGKSYQVGRIIVRGNPTIQDRVIRRQIRIYPDQTYDTVLVSKSTDRLKAVGIFRDVKITPIGNDPDTRDALVEVAEGQTGKFLVGAGLSTNTGLIGQLSVEQQNFDIANFPESMDEFLHGQSFKGAGQYFRILLEPGTQLQSYRVTFEEPYMFDTAYSFGNDAYFFTRTRESWDETRIGDIITLGHRLGDIYAFTIGFRAEDVKISNPQDFGIKNIEDTPSDTAQEILDQVGSHFLTSIKPGVTRDTTDSRIFPSSGSRIALYVEQYGAMGGSYDFTKIVGRYDQYFPIYTDLFDRKTVFAFRNEVGFIPAGDSVFFERFYGGGIGSLRAFKFRGVGPRAGPLSDPVGGDFTWVSTGEVNYPLYENILRGVVFVDVGDVEQDISIGTIRGDAGLGFRITIPFFGQLPLAVDFGYPFAKAKGDKTQIISFSLGLPF